MVDLPLSLDSFPGLAVVGGAEDVASGLVDAEKDVGVFEIEYIIERVVKFRSRQCRFFLRADQAGE